MPVCQRLHVLGKRRLNLGDRLTQRLQPGGSQVLVVALRKDVPYLPVVKAIEDHQDTANAKTSENAALAFRKISRNVGKAKPQDVHGRGSLDGLKADQVTHPREPSVRADHQWSSYFVRPVGAEITHAAHLSIFLDQLLHVGAHYQPKIRI